MSMDSLVTASAFGALQLISGTLAGVKADGDRISLAIACVGTSIDWVNSNNHLVFIVLASIIVFPWMMKFRISKPFAAIMAVFSAYLYTEGNVGQFPMVIYWSIYAYRGLTVSESMA